MSFIRNLFSRKQQKVNPHDGKRMNKHWRKVKVTFEEKQVPFDSIPEIVRKRRIERWNQMKRDIARYQKQKLRDSLSSRERRLLYDQERRGSTKSIATKSDENEDDDFDVDDRRSSRERDGSNSRGIPVIIEEREEEEVEHMRMRNNNGRGVRLLEIEDFSGKRKSTKLQRGSFRGSSIVSKLSRCSFRGSSIVSKLSRGSFRGSSIVSIRKEITVRHPLF